LIRRARMTRIPQTAFTKALPYSCHSRHSCHSAVHAARSPRASSKKDSSRPRDHIPGERRRPRSAARTELLQKGRDVMIHRARREEETLTDFPIREPLRQQLEHLHLPIGETRRIRSRAAPRSTRETTDATALQLASHDRRRRRRTQSLENLESSSLRFLIALAERERLLVGTARSFPGLRGLAPTSRELRGEWVGQVRHRA